MNEILKVSFDSSPGDKSALCVCGVSEGKTIMLKWELGEQADILHRLLTEQKTKAEIKKEKNIKITFEDKAKIVISQLREDRDKLQNIINKIKTEIKDTGAYEQEVHGKTEFLEGINYCLSIIDKCETEMENKE